MFTNIYIFPINHVCVFSHDVIIIEKFKSEGRELVYDKNNI